MRIAATLTNTVIPNISSDDGLFKTLEVLALEALFITLKLFFECLFNEWRIYRYNKFVMFTVK